MIQARLYIPAFTKRKSLLSVMEVTETTIANDRILVACVIGSIRQKYSLLQSTNVLTMSSSAGLFLEKVSGEANQCFRKLKGGIGWNSNA